MINDYVKTFGRVGRGREGTESFPGQDYLFIIILRNLEPLGKQCSSFPLDYTRKSFTLTIVTFALNF